MNLLTCPDCHLAIITANTEEKMCKCEFMSLVEKKKFQIGKVAPEVQEFIKELVNKEELINK